MVSLTDLLTGMNWSLARIDQEIRNGNVEIVRRGGVLKFRILSGEHSMQVVKFREPAQRIASHINRKSA